MPEKKEYRSAIRSRRMIREAYMELVEEKKDGKVTVTDIVKRADINRSTFYAHYQDVQGVVEEMEEELIEQLQPWAEIEYVNVSQNPKAFLDNMAVMLEQNEKIYHILAKSNYAEHFKKRIEELLIQYLENSGEIPDIIRNSPFFDFIMAFTVGGIINVFDKWFQGDLEYSLSDLTREMEKIILNVPDSTLNLGWGINVELPKQIEE